MTNFTTYKVIMVKIGFMLFIDIIYIHSSIIIKYESLKNFVGFYYGWLKISNSSWFLFGN